VLDTDYALRQKIENALNKLYPYKIGSREIFRNGITIGKMKILAIGTNRIYLDYTPDIISI